MRSQRYVTSLARVVNERGVEGYLAATYWAEIFRLAESAKVHALAKGAYFAIAEGRMKPFADFVHAIPRSRVRLSVWDVILLNMYTLRDLCKHVRTNALGGSSNRSYVLRKIRKVIRR